MKSVITYSDYGEEDSLGRYFKIYNSTGISESGFSGSPVFCGDPSSGSVKAVGWTVATATGSFLCGDENQVSQCGMFTDLFLNTDIISNINPTYSFSQESSQPTTDVLPSHCSNCIQDGDETAIDCGGSCQPCGMSDEIYATTTADIYGRENINARFDLEVDGGSNSVEFTSGTYNLTAGENITLKSFKVAEGTTFKASVNADLMYAEAQGCQDSCVAVSEYFTPNGDGLNDFVIASFAFVEEYDVLIINSWGTTVYSSYNNPIYENGVYSVWDGSGLNNNAYYFVILAKGCDGNVYTFTGYVTLLKSAYVDSEITSVSKDVKMINDFVVFPNPTEDILKIGLSHNLILQDESYNITISDLSGKKVFSGNYCNYVNEIDVSNFNQGTYVVMVESLQGVLTKKFIKK